MEQQSTTSLPQISASKLKTWRTCSKKYYYTYVSKPTLEEHREEKNVGALLGSVLHRVIYEYYKDISINPLALYQEKMFGTLDEWQSANYNIIGEQWFSKQLLLGREILEKLDWTQFSPVALELHFTIPFPTDAPICKLTGFIDMISDDTVIDHKSQKEIESADEMANNAQFLLYRYAYNVLYGHYPRAIIWHDLRTQTCIDTGVQNNYDAKIAQLINDIKTMLQATHYSRIELSDTCRKRCGFYKLCWDG